MPEKEFEHLLSYAGLLLHYTVDLVSPDKNGVVKYLYSCELTHPEFENTCIRADVYAAIKPGKTILQDAFSAPHKIADQIILRYTISGILNNQPFEHVNAKTKTRTSIVGMHSTADEIVGLEFFKPRKEIDVVFTKLIRTSIIRLFTHFKVDIPQPFLPESTPKPPQKEVTKKIEKENATFLITSEHNTPDENPVSSREIRSKTL